MVARLVTIRCYNCGNLTKEHKVQSIYLIFILPIVMSLISLVVPNSIKYILVSIIGLVLGFISIELYLNSQIFSLVLSSFQHYVIIFLDVVLLIYFLYIGMFNGSKKVALLAFAQIILFTIAELSLSGHASDIVVDGLSSFMLIVINIIGSLIIFYAIKYISYEENMSERKKSLFLFYLILFLSVMNLIVSANSIMLFFFLFELTTFASYLLIGIRGDETSQNNALRALWMNQIGGILILLAVIFGAEYFNSVSADDIFVLVAFSLIAVGVMIKGAQLPFDSWLLGAMVAPTPVSAILHSATMVKIAPFVMLKIAPILALSASSLIISIFGAFVFMVAAFYALDKSKFKEILGYSTISMLALMITIGAVGTLEAAQIVIILILFHAISKAQLFLIAGVLEKKYHIKDVENFGGLIQKSPILSYMLILGFASVTLPPFGLFFGKVFSLSYLLDLIKNEPFYILVFLFFIIGSTFLTLLYFKVITTFFAKDVSHVKEKESIDFGFLAPLFILTLMLITSPILLLYMGVELPIVYTFGVLAIVLALPQIINSFTFKGADRVKEYNCGERAEFKIAMFTYSLSEKTYKDIAFICIALLVLVILGVFL